MGLLLHRQLTQLGSEEAGPPLVTLLLLLEAVAILSELQPRQSLHLLLWVIINPAISPVTSLWLVHNLWEHLLRLSLPSGPALRVHGTLGVHRGVAQLWHDYKIGAVIHLVLDLFQVAVAVLGRLGEHLFLGWKMVVFMYLLLFCTEFAVERGVQHVATHHVLAVVYDFLPPAVA